MVAFEWKIPIETLKQRLEATYEGGCKNSQYKAILQNSYRNASRIPKEDLEKLRILPKFTRQAKASTPATVPATPTAMEELRQKREELQKKIARNVFCLREKREIFHKRNEDLVTARSVLEKAQEADCQATIAQIEAWEALRQEELRQEELRLELQRVEEEIFKRYSGK